MRIKSWPKAGLDVVDPLGKTYHFKGNEILRLLNMQAPGGTRYWSLYIDESKHGENVNLGTVQRVGPVTITGSPAFTLCDGSSMNVDAVADLITPLGGVFTDACPNS